VPDAPARDEVVALRAANVRLREVIGARDTEIGMLREQVEALAAQVSELRARLGKNSLLTEQGRVFPQLDRLAVALGLYGHRSWLGSGIGILRRWWCRCRVRWWRPGTGMSRSG